MEMKELCMSMDMMISSKYNIMVMTMITMIISNMLESVVINSR